MPAMTADKKPVALVIFGATGDLTLRKLMPALLELQEAAFLNRVHTVIGVGRRDQTIADYRAAVETQIPESDRRGEHWSTFTTKLDYCRVADEKGYAALTQRLGALTGHEVVYYLATPPALYAEICGGLKAAGALASPSRVVLEKPLGHDLKSCREIHEQVATAFDEASTFRIDHYLGKETVQNLLALRFGNTLLFPLWNNHYIDNVQITVAESLGVEGRADFYGPAGALRDMVQNHLLQILAMVAMEPPTSLRANSIRDEKVKVLKALRPFSPELAKRHSVRGQYDRGAIDGEAVPGLRENPEFAPYANTETFVALRAEISNWRWAGVPFYLRTGKRLTQRYSEIVLQFKQLPYSIFPGDHNNVPNQLVISIQPQENIRLQMVNKRPGLSEGLRLQPVSLNLTQSDGTRYGAYERLLLDAINGDQTLFMRRDEVETAWRWVDSIIDGWGQAGVELKSYAAGSMGPNAALAIPEREGRSWHEHS